MPSVTWLEERYVATLAWTLRHRVATFFLVLAGLVAGFLPFALDLVETGMFSGEHQRAAADRVPVRRLLLQVGQREGGQPGGGLPVTSNAERFLVRGLYWFFGENEAGTVITLARPDLSDREMQGPAQPIRAELPKIPGVRVYFEDDSAEAGGTQHLLRGQALRPGQRDPEPPGGGGRAPARDSRRGGGHRPRRSHRGAAGDPGHARPRQGTAARADRAGHLEPLRLHPGRHAPAALQRRRPRGGDLAGAARWRTATNLEDLKRIQVRSAGRPSPVTLGDVATFQVVLREQEIQRENRKVQTEVRAVYEGKNLGRHQGEDRRV